MSLNRETLCHQHIIWTSSLLWPLTIFAQSSPFYPILPKSYALQWVRHFPKSAPPVGASASPSNTCSLGTPDSASQTAFRLVQSFLHGSRLQQTNWLTDHATQSVTIGCIYTCSTAMQPTINCFTALEVYSVGDCRNKDRCTFFKKPCGNTIRTESHWLLR